MTTILAQPETVKVGRKVPEFGGQVLRPDGSFGSFKLSENKGKWLVVFFYPLDFTFVCPTEIRSFNDHYAAFKKANTDVLSVSTDSVFTHKAWVEHGLGKIQFPMLADTNHDVSKLFGVLIPEKGITLRGTFIIDADGVLKASVVNELAVGRNVEETLRTLQALQTGELTQCGWQPGQKTLGKA